MDHSTLDLISALCTPCASLRGCCARNLPPRAMWFSRRVPLKALKQDLLVRRLCREIAIERLEESDVADYLTKTFHHPSASRVSQT